MTDDLKAKREEERIAQLVAEADRVREEAERTERLRAAEEKLAEEKKKLREAKYHSIFDLFKR